MNPFLAFVTLLSALVLLCASSLAASEEIHARFHNDAHADGHDHDATCALCLFSHSGLEGAPVCDPAISAPTTWSMQPFRIPSSTVVVGIRLRPDGRGPPGLG